MKNRLSGRAIAIVLAAAWSQYSPAAVNVDRTRIIMDSGDKTVAITLSNDDRSTPYLAQSWVTGADGTRTSALMALPPLQRVDGGQKVQVRITQVLRMTEQLPQDRETLFWFNVRGIPPKADVSSSLQLAMQSRLKLFYRPKSIARSSNDRPERELTAERDAGHLTLKNPTPYYITVAWLGTQRDRQLRGIPDAIMVPPFGSLPLKTDLPAETRQLWVGYIDDYGGLQMNRYACDARQCALKDGGASS
ncbi:TPA: fimbria/pilus periplasmic chaperone [Salmonella enterica]|uniref:Fimbria/pilus periplasmic chaperone n=1 Tax=Salmonella enterica TaxID=28901 RepID=A0A757VYH2_SALER|nr:fimbria/pilus periplasmic chaperone [Salmonella enterica]